MIRFEMNALDDPVAVGAKAVVVQDDPATRAVMAV